MAHKHLLLISILIVAGGCRSRRQQPLPSTSPAAADAEVETEAHAALPEEPNPIQFDDERLRRRYTALRACVLDRVGDGSWIHQPPTRRGYVHEEVWCRPLPGHESCSVELSTAEASEHYQLRTLTGFDDRDERLEVMAHRAGLPGGWDLSISIQPWTGGFTFGFSRDDDQIHLGQHFGFATGQINISPPPDTVSTDIHGWLDAEMGFSLRSAEGMRDRAFARLDQLLEAVETTINSHTLSVCPDPDDPGRFECFSTADGQAHGMRDTCARRRPTTAEKAAILDEARRDIGARRALVEHNFSELYPALLEALPLDRCWPLPARLRPEHHRESPSNSTAAQRAFFESSP